MARLNNLIGIVAALGIFSNIFCRDVGAQEVLKGLQEDTPLEYSIPVFREKSFFDILREEYRKNEIYNALTVENVLYGLVHYEGVKYKPGERREVLTLFADRLEIKLEADPFLLRSTEVERAIRENDILATGPMAESFWDALTMKYRGFGFFKKSVDEFKERFTREKIIGPGQTIKIRLTMSDYDGSINPALGLVFDSRSYNNIGKIGLDGGLDGIMLKWVFRDKENLFSARIGYVPDEGILKAGFGYATRF